MIKEGCLMIGIGVVSGVAGALYSIEKKRMYSLVLPIILYISFSGLTLLTLNVESLFPITLAICIILYIITVIFVIKQRRRLNIPLEQLPEKQKSKKPALRQVLPYSITIVLLIITYFTIGAISRHMPYVPPEEFNQTRINPNLSDEEN